MRIAAGLLLLACVASGAEPERPGYVGVMPKFDGVFVHITEVVEDSPAGDADILVGDRIVTVNGYYPTSEQHYRQLTAGPAGTKVELTILKPDGTRREVQVVKRPVKEPARYFGLFARQPDLVVTELSAVEQAPSREQPKGRGRARGRVLLDGRPWADALIAVRIYGNDRRTPFARSDADGYYTVSVPTGTTPVKGFWLQRPPTFEDTVLMTGATEWAGVTCAAGPEKVCRLPVVEAATPPELTKPPKNAMVREREVAFEWAPVEGAASYALEIRPLWEGAGDRRMARTVTEPGFCCYTVPDDPKTPRHAYVSWGVTALSPTGKRLSATRPGDGAFVFKTAD